MGNSEQQQLLSPVFLSPARAPTDLTRDSTRNPLGVLDFLDLRRNQRVLDFCGGDGYWSVLFSALVGKGVGVWVHNSSERRDLIESSVKRRAATPEPTQNPSNLRFFFAPLLQPVPPVPPLCSKPECVNCQGAWRGWDEQFDVVFVYARYQDALESEDVFNAAVYKLLRPGGRLFVVEHSAAPGTGLQFAGPKSHRRIDELAVVDQVSRAGFEFVGQSNALSNPADNRNSVVPEDDSGVLTDRFILKFQKPGGAEQDEAAYRCLIGHW